MEPKLNDVSLKKLLLSVGMIAIIGTTVILTGAFFIKIRDMGWEKTLHLPTVFFRTKQPQHVLQTAPLVASLTSTPVRTYHQVFEKTASASIYSSGYAFLPQVNTPHEGYSSSQTQWLWQLGANAFYRDDVSAGLAHLEQRIAADILYMLKLIIVVGAITIVVVITGGVLIARYVTRRMVQDGSDGTQIERVAKPTPEDPNLCNGALELLCDTSLGNLSAIDENKRCSDRVPEDSGLAILNVSIIEEGGQLISDSEMTLEAILTAMQQVGDAVTEMAMNQLEQAEEATSNLQTSAEMAARVHHRCELKNKIADSACEDQALTLRRLMAFSTPCDETSSKQASNSDSHTSLPSDSKTITATSAKTTSEFLIH